MSKMKGYSPREFMKLLVSNGWRFDRGDGSHVTYIKPGEHGIVTFPDKGKELSRPLVSRLIKEAHLAVH